MSVFEMSFRNYKKRRTIINVGGPILVFDPDIILGRYAYLNTYLSDGFHFFAQRPRCAIPHLLRDWLNRLVRPVLCSFHFYYVGNLKPQILFCPTFLPSDFADGIACNNYIPNPSTLP